MTYYSESNSNLAVVEYTGCFPDKIKLRGNSKIETPPPYMRTNSEVFCKMEKSDRKVGPNELYDNLVRDNDIMDAPRNLRQIVNKRAYQKKKIKLIPPVTIVITTKMSPITFNNYSTG